MVKITETSYLIKCSWWPLIDFKSESNGFRFGPISNPPEDYELTETVKIGPFKWTTKTLCQAIPTK